MTDSHDRTGLDPTRDPERPGPPAGPRDSRTPPPSTLDEEDGPGSTGPPTGGRPPQGAPTERSSGGDEPL